MFQAQRYLREPLRPCQPPCKVSHDHSASSCRLSADSPLMGGPGLPLFLITISQPTTPMIADVSRRPASLQYHDAVQGVRCRAGV